MHLVSDIHQGFQAKSHLRTVLATFDLSSVFNRVEHIHLIYLFSQLVILPVYACFYQSFLCHHSFHIRCGRAYSSWAKESCGTPQGTISSPILFLIYMEGMLCSVAPTAANVHINLSLYANDFTIWTSSYQIQETADVLTTFINDTVLPWAKQYNSLLNPGKCHSFLFSNYHHDP